MALVVSLTFAYKLLSSKSYILFFSQVNKWCEREIMVVATENCSSYPSLTCSFNDRFRRSSIYVVENMTWVVSAKIAP